MKGKLKETETLSITSQYDVKTKIENTQKNNKYGQCGDRDETVNCITGECSK